MKINKYEELGVIFLSASLMCINIFLSIPLLVYATIRNSKSILIIIPLFFSVLAYRIVPTYEYDLYRIYENYQQYKLFDEYYFVRDGFLLFLYFLMKNLDFSKELLPFIACFLIFYSKIKFVQKINIGVPLNNKYSNLLFLFISLMSVPLLQFSGIRFSSAIAFLSLSVIFFNEKKIYKTFLFSILAVFCHISSLIFVFALILSLLFNDILNKNKLFLLIISAGCGVFSTEVVQFFSHYIDIINSMIGWNFFSIETYITGEWGVDRNNNLNENGVLVLNLTKIVTIYFLLYTVIFLPKNNLSGGNVILISMTLIFYQFGTLFDRISQFSIILMLYTLCKNIDIFCISRLYRANIYVLFSFLLISRAIDLRNSYSLIESIFIDFSNLSVMKIALGG